MQNCGGLQSVDAVPIRGEEGTTVALRLVEALGTWPVWPWSWECWDKFQWNTSSDTLCRQDVVTR